jgi:hypothetical protein
MSTQTRGCPVREQLKRQALDLLDAAWAQMNRLRNARVRGSGDSRQATAAANVSGM